MENKLKIFFCMSAVLVVGQSLVGSEKYLNNTRHMSIAQEFDHRVLCANKQQEVFNYAFRQTPKNDYSQTRNQLEFILKHASLDEFMKSILDISVRSPREIKDVLYADSRLLLACYAKQHEYTQSFFQSECRIPFEQTLLYKEMIQEMQKN